MAFWLAVAMTTALAAAQPAPPTVSKKTATGMVVSGAMLTAVSTWASGMVAARFLDSRNTQEMGRVLPIPFAGPIAAAAMGPPAYRPLAALGMMQGGGLSLMTIGAVSLARHRRQDPGPNLRMTPSSLGVLAVTQGIVWLSITWSMTYGFSRTRAEQGDAFARRLQIPIVGGILAAPRAPNYTRGYLGLTSSALQIASASVIVFGGVVLAKHRRQRHLSVLPVPTPQGLQVVTSIRF